MPSVNLDADRLTLTEVAKLLDRNIATIFRWRIRGVRGVKLKTFCIGGRRYVARSDLDAFIDSLNPDGDARPEPVPHVNPHEVEKTERALDALGI